MGSIEEPPHREQTCQREDTDIDMDLFIILAAVIGVGRPLHPLISESSLYSYHDMPVEEVMEILTLFQTPRTLIVDPGFWDMDKDKQRSIFESLNGVWDIVLCPFLARGKDWTLLVVDTVKNETTCLGRGVKLDGRIQSDVVFAARDLCRAGGLYQSMKGKLKMASQTLVALRTLSNCCLGCYSRTTCRVRPGSYCCSKLHLSLCST